MQEKKRKKRDQLILSLHKGSWLQNLCGVAVTNLCLEQHDLGKSCQLGGLIGMKICNPPDVVEYILNIVNLVPR